MHSKSAYRKIIAAAQPIDPLYDTPLRRRQREATARYQAKRKEQIRVGAREAYQRDRARNAENARRAWLRRTEIAAGRPRPEACELCGGPPTGHSQLHFDHDHETGKFRGWLCSHCNLALGHASDSPTRLRALADYIERSR